MPSLLSSESKKPLILTTILLISYFTHQFHIADILGKVLQREGWELKRFSLLTLLLITRVSQLTKFWIWWLRAHRSQGQRTEETNSLPYAIPRHLKYIIFVVTELPGAEAATSTQWALLPGQEPQLLEVLVRALVWVLIFHLFSTLIRQLHPQFVKRQTKGRLT